MITIDIRPKYVTTIRRLVPADTETHYIMKTQFKNITTTYGEDYIEISQSEWIDSGFFSVEKQAQKPSLWKMVKSWIVTGSAHA